MVKAVRGAVQIGEDNPGSIDTGVQDLMKEIIEKNNVREEDIVSIQFSQTWDLVSKNPAAALRKSGYAEVPLFCTQEPAYAGSMPRVIRLLLTWNSSDGMKPVPVYLGGAKKLRPDIV